MSDLIVNGLEETEIMRFCPNSIITRSSATRQARRLCRSESRRAKPEYVAAVHSHPYMEILHIFDGVAEVMDRQSGRSESHFAQRQHDRDPGRDAASSRTVGNKVLRLLGAHASRSASSSTRMA